MILEISGWLLVVCLVGSTIHSTKFHVGTYLLQKQRIKNKEVGEVYKSLHKQMNWSFLIFIQIGKLIIAFSLFYFFLK